jgi:hypothetical protein
MSSDSYGMWTGFTAEPQAAAPPTIKPESQQPPSQTSGSNPQSPEERKGLQTTPHGLNARSCVTCRRRKVKCDKQVPCSNCTKAQTQCVFPAPGRAPRRPRQGGKVVSEREAELLKRLRRLEGVVEELSGQVEIDGIKHSPTSDHSSTHKDGESTDSCSKPNSVRVVGMDEGTSKKAWLQRGFSMGLGPPKSAFSLQTGDVGGGRLVVDEGKSQYLSNPFWASISEVSITFHK